MSELYQSLSHSKWDCKHTPSLEGLRLMLGQSVEYNLCIHSELRMGPSEEPTEPAETRRNLIRVGGVSLRGRALPYRSGPHRRNRRAKLARNRRGAY